MLTLVEPAELATLRVPELGVQVQRRGLAWVHLPFADHGRRYCVKTLESTALARNEYLAAALYPLAGVPTLHHVPTVRPHEVATEWLALDKSRQAQFEEAERQQARHWLGVHAWTANWDAVGLLGDNLGVAQGRVLTLDLGGALAFRAQGDPKGPAFGTRVDGLDRLRHDADNPAARRERPT